MKKPTGNAEQNSVAKPWLVCETHPYGTELIEHSRHEREQLAIAEAWELNARGQPEGPEYVVCNEADMVPKQAWPGFITT